MTGGDDKPGEQELPKPTPELILVGIWMRASLRRLPKKERLSMLQEVTEALDDMASGVNVHSIRPQADAAAVKDASVKARGWWERALGRLVTAG